jgi:hypothetical protein
VADHELDLELVGKVDRTLGVAQPLLVLLAIPAEGSNRLGAAWFTPGGNGQKLWVVPICITPSSTAFMMPGTNVIRMP